MNKILKKIMILLAAGAIVAACSNDFLEWDQTAQLDESTAIQNANHLENAVVGIYNRIAFPSGFLGRNVQTKIELLGDVAGLRGGVSSNWFEPTEMWTHTDTDGRIIEIWQVGYQAIDRAARVITAGHELLQETQTEADIRRIHLSIAQAHGLKALAHFYLVNFFGLPYTYQPESYGIVVVGNDRITVEQSVNGELYRSTVRQTYAQILADIADAKTHFELAGNAPFPAATQRFFFTRGAVYALEARVHLFMANWGAATTAAQQALNISGATIVNDSAAYVSMWGSLTPTNEDIFVLNYTTLNIGTPNHMNGMWRTNGAAMYPRGHNKIQPTDIRRGMLFQKPNAASMFTMKFPNTISNIPIFRASEMFLIMAEANAQLGQIPQAQAFLFQVAQRDRAIANVAGLTSDRDELLAFIADERVRELTQEGHRWFDLRRRGDLMSRTPGESLRDIAGLDVRRTVLPIPAIEVNASGINQNNWTEVLP